MYEVGNYYQDFRRFSQSRSEYQLAGNTITNSSDCFPFYNNIDFPATTSWAGLAYDGTADHCLHPDKVASPCGAIARAFYNDTFTMHVTSNFTAISIN